MPMGTARIREPSPSQKTCLGVSNFSGRKTFEGKEKFLPPRGDLGTDFLIVKQRMIDHQCGADRSGDDGGADFGGEGKTETKADFESLGVVWLAVEFDQLMTGEEKKKVKKRVNSVKVSKLDRKDSGSVTKGG